MKFLPIRGLCDMKLPPKKSYLGKGVSARRAKHRPILVPTEDVSHKVRRTMVKRAEKLIKDRNYPRHTIVVELAKLFTSKFISERN